MNLVARLRSKAPHSWKLRYRAVRGRMQLFRFSIYDARRFGRISASCNSQRGIEQQDAEITRSYHTIEKGLSIRTPRPGFGSGVLTDLCRLLSVRMKEDGPWTQSCADAVDALQGYVDFNQATGGRVIPEVSATLVLARQNGHMRQHQPTQVLRRKDVEEAVAFDAEKFFWTRHSVRQFSPGPIDELRLREAIDLARSTPSVCNRQSSRVKLIINNGKKMEFLKHQNGNRGFGADAQAILVITSDQRSFIEASERYQAWIDGGMFAMTMALALHAKGFGACCLNWSQTDKADMLMRNAIGLPEEETIIMLIAVGNLPEELPVARSHRLELDQVLTDLTSALS